MSWTLQGALGSSATTLATPDVTAMQGIWQDSTGAWWATQPTVDTSGDDKETTLLARFDKSGVLQDYMTITDGGHGVSFAVDATGDDPVVYWRWQYGDQNLVKFTYAGGTTIAETDAGVTQVWAGPVAFFGVNPNVDRVMIRDAGAGGSVACHLRKWSDVLAGTDDELATISISSSQPQNGHTFQGHTTDDTYLYELTGMPSSDEPAYIWQYSWADGSVAAKRDVTLFGSNDPAGVNEPEGIAFSLKTSDDPVLLFGMSTGSRTDRGQLTFRLTAPGPTPPPIPTPTEVPFLIELWDTSLNRVGVLANPTSVDVTVAANAQGVAEIEVPVAHGLIPTMLTHGTRATLQYRGTQVMSGILSHREGEVVADNGTLTFTITDDFVLFDSMLCWPGTLADGFISPGRDNQTGPAETVFKHYVQTAVTRLGDALAIPVTVATDQGRGDNLTIHARWQPISDYFFPRRLRDAGLTVTTKQTSSGIVVDVREPAHYPLTLTPESGIVTAATVSMDPPAVTRAAAGTAEAGTERAYSTYVDSAVEAEWGIVREVFVDASGVDTTDEKYLDELTALAKAAVVAGSATSGLSLQLSEVPSFQYTVDLQVGDWVTESLLPGGGAARTHHLSTVSLTWSEDDGFIPTPAVGDLTTHVPRWMRKLDHSVRHIRELEAH